MQQSSWKQWVGALGAAFVLFHWTADISWVIISVNDDRIGDNVKPILDVGLIIIGAFLGAVSADIFGRKRTLLATLIFVIPRLIAVIFEVKKWVWISEIFVVFGSGVACTVVPLYISEIARSNNRVNLMVMQLLVHQVGIFAGLFIILITVRLDIEHTTEIIESVVLVITILFHGIVLAVFPETPQYLNSKEKYQEAAESLAFFRGNNHVEIRGNAIDLPVHAQPNNKQRNCCGKLSELFRFENRRSLAIIFSLIVMRWASGQRRVDLLIFDWIVHYDHSQVFENTLGVYGGYLIATILIMVGIGVLRRKVCLILVILVNFIAAVIGMTPLIFHTWILFAILFIQHFGHLIFVGITLAYTGEFFSISVRAVAIAVVISFEILIRNLFIMVENAMFNEGMVIQYTPFHSYINGGVLFVSFIFFLIFLPKTNKVPNCEIEIETSARGTYIP